VTAVDDTTKVEQLSTREAINQALDLAMDLDPSVFLLGEDIADPGGGVYQVTKGLSTKYGLDRVRPTPISEQAIAGAAVGAAVAGMRPVAEIMIMNFFAVCLDQVVNHAAKLRYMSGGQTHVPVTFRCSAGGGMQFGAQHSDMLEAWLTHVPGLKVVVPSTPADAKGLLLSCIFDDDPCVFVEQVFGYFMTGDVPVGDVRVPLGTAEVKREGSDVTILGYGRQLNDVISAADAVTAQGISAEVIDLRSLVPLDEEAILTSAAKTKRVVIVHEAVERGGFGAELAALVAGELGGELQGPIVRVAGKNTPVPFASSLEWAYMPGVPDILAAVQRATGTG